MTVLTHAKDGDMNPASCPGQLSVIERRRVCQVARREAHVVNPFPAQQPLFFKRSAQHSVNHLAVASRIAGWQMPIADPVCLSGRSEGSVF